MSDTEVRLRWALRYVMCHPDFSPSILSDEWKMDIDLCIEVCAHTFSESVINHNCIIEGKFEELESKIFEKLKSL